MDNNQMRNTEIRKDKQALLISFLAELKNDNILLSFLFK